MPRALALLGVVAATAVFVAPDGSPPPDRPADVRAQSAGQKSGAKERRATIASSAAQHVETDRDAPAGPIARGGAEPLVLGAPVASLGPEAGSPATVEQARPDAVSSSERAADSLVASNTVSETSPERHANPHDHAAFLAQQAALEAAARARVAAPPAAPVVAVQAPVAPAVPAAPVEVVGPIGPVGPVGPVDPGSPGGPSIPGTPEPPVSPDDAREAAVAVVAQVQSATQGAAAAVDTMLSEVSSLVTPVTAQVSALVTVEARASAAAAPTRGSVKAAAPKRTAVAAAAPKRSAVALVNPANLVLREAPVARPAAVKPRAVAAKPDATPKRARRAAVAAVRPRAEPVRDTESEDAEDQDEPAAVVRTVAKREVARPARRAVASDTITIPELPSAPEPARQILDGSGNPLVVIESTRRAGLPETTARIGSTLPATIAPVAVPTPPVSIAGAPIGAAPVQPLPISAPVGAPIAAPVGAPIAAPIAAPVAPIAAPLAPALGVPGVSVNGLGVRL